MDDRLQICFQGMETSTALEAKIRDRYTQLERRCPELTGCRVTVTKESRTHLKGNLFRIGLVLHRPGRDVVVSHGAKDHGHEDVYAALRDTFAAAERQVAELGR
jgi:ribosome-associated translation inhibitor RaiA